MRWAFLISGHEALKVKAAGIVEGAGLDGRAANSVELRAASF
jgi:hypothetical protein